MDGTIINDFIKYDNNLEDLNKNHILFNQIKKLLDKNKDKKFFTYYRSDESLFYSTYFDCLSNHQ